MPNLAAFGLDRRLSALAAATGARYSRYADDLVFSFRSDRQRTALTRLIHLVERIVSEEGFQVNKAKTSIRTAGQRQCLAGVVVNQKLNVRRSEYDELRAILHNAARGGADAQNRENRPHFEAYLLGRIGWVAQLNPERGARLRASLALIDWHEGEERPLPLITSTLRSPTET